MKSTTYQEIINNPGDYSVCGNCGTIHTNMRLYCANCQSPKLHRIFKTNIKSILENHSDELDLSFCVE